MSRGAAVSLSQSIGLSDSVLDLGIEDVTSHRSAHPNAKIELARISGDMRTECVNFVSRGNPGWPRYDPQTRSTRVHNAEPTTLPYPEEPSRRLWANHRFDTLDLIARPRAPGRV